MLLALLGRPAAAADDRASSPSPAPTTAALPESPLLAPATTSALPAAPDAIITLKTPPRTHKFFDARNTLALTSLAATLSADAISTQKGLAYPGFHEMN